MAEIMKCPCHGCTERWVDTNSLTSCRSRCERHAKWQKQEQARRAKIQAENSASYAVYEHFKNFKIKREKRGYYKKGK